MSGVYDLQAPTAWVAAPERFGVTTLAAIEECPRRWQLLHSAWGDHPTFPERVSPRSVEGTIVHEALDGLLRALGARGLPSFGTEQFKAAAAASGFWEHFSRRIQEVNTSVAAHPRSGPGFLLKTPPRELANVAVRLLRAHYRPLDKPVLPSVTAPRSTAKPDPMKLLRARGNLSEVRVEHPRLPIVGTIDLVELSGSSMHIVDFKTGAHRPEHVAQVLAYALLWWRQTGEPPAGVSVQSPDQRITRSVTAQELEGVEQSLESRIGDVQRKLKGTPAAAKVGVICAQCPVKARCDAGWYHHQGQRPRGTAGTTDLEVTITGVPLESGFECTSGGRRVSVVYDVSAVGHLTTFKTGMRLRLIDAVARENEDVVEIRAWTEVFVA